MQTIWKGSVSFGLVSIPVRLYSATEEKNVSFRQVHREDGGRIRYRRVCELDGEEVSYGEIAKGYEMPDGEMVILEKEDFDSLPLTSSRAIDVLQFVPLEQIDPLMYAKAYYLQADGPGTKPYVLLRDALTRSDRVAIVKVALRNREQLAALRVKDDVLVLQTMLWPDEVRDASSLAPDDVSVRDQEVAMAESYIETLTDDFSPDAYTDEYREALEELIAAKAKGAQPAAPEDGARAGDNVLDLMAALRASVEAAKAKRAGGAGAPEAAQPDEEGPAGQDAPAGGTTAGKAPAKKAATKRAGGKAPVKKAATKTAATKTAASKAPASKAAKTTAKAASSTSATAAKKTATKRTRKSA